MIDKLLLVLLITLLPLGIVVSKRVFSPETDAVTARETQIQEVEKLISQLSETQVDQTDATNTLARPITVSGIGFASDSGILRLEGQAPTAATLVKVSFSYLPKVPDIPELNPEVPDPVLGQDVVVKAVKPNESGHYVLEYKVPYKEGIIETTITQGESEQTIQFDLNENRQLL